MKSFLGQLEREFRPLKATVEDVSINTENFDTSNKRHYW